MSWKMVEEIYEQRDGWLDFDFHCSKAHGLINTEPFLLQCNKL